MYATVRCYGEGCGWRGPLISAYDRKHQTYWKNPEAMTRAIEAWNTRVAPLITSWAWVEGTHEALTDAAEAGDLDRTRVLARLLRVVMQKDLDELGAELGTRLASLIPVVRD